MSVAIYRYTARTAQGEIVRGSMEASNPDSVLASLRTRALFVTAIAKDAGTVASLGRLLLPGNVPKRALMGFFRSFATLIRAGVSMRRALTVAVERTSDAKLKEALSSILADVEHGTSLSDACARRPRAFPPLYVSMLRAGEAGGILDEVLERLSGFLERDNNLRKKVQSALAYPIVVLSAAVVLVIFMIAKIVPMFAGMFESFQVELPWNTSFLLALGHALENWYGWAFIITVTIGAITALKLTTRTASGALFIDRIRLRIPLVGSLIRKSTTARIARMLGTLMRSGVELVTAIEVITPVAGSPNFARALREVNVALREGDSLTRPLTDSKMFDPMFLALVGVGEETGLLDEMLIKIAEYFETDVEAVIASLGAIVEPVLIVFLGGVVGFIVFSIFIPLYTLIGNVSK